MSKKTPYQLKKRILDASSNDLAINRTPGSSPLRFDAVRSSVNLSKLQKYAKTSAAVGTRDNQKLIDESAAYFQGNLRRNLNLFPKATSAAIGMAGTLFTTLFDGIIFSGSNNSKLGKFFNSPYNNEQFSPNQNVKNFTYELTQIEKKFSEEYFPILHRRDYADKSVASQLGSSEFYGSEVAQGVGFMAGMIIPGAVLKSLNMFSSFGKVLGRAGNIGNTSARINNTLAYSIRTLRKTPLGSSASGRSLIKDFSNFTRKGLHKNNLSLQTYTGLQTWSEANLERLFAQESLHNTLKQYQKEGKVNPATNKPWTDEEIFEKVKTAGDSIFSANLLVLGISNTIMNRMLFKEGPPKITKGSLAARSLQLSEGEAAAAIVGQSPKVSRIGSILNKTKNFGKAVINKDKATLGKTIFNSIVREGFWEEGTQTMLESRAIAKALEESDPDTYNYVSNLMGAYTKMLGTNEGIKSVLLGAVISLPFSIFGHYKQKAEHSKAVDSILSGKSKLSTLTKKYFNTLYETNADGSLKFDDNQQPILRVKNAVAQAATQLEEQIHFEFLHALAERDPETFEELYLTDVLPQYVQMYLQFDETFEIFESDIKEEFELYHEEQKKKNPNYTPRLTVDKIISVANQMREGLDEFRSTADLVYDPVRDSELYKDSKSKEEEDINRINAFQWDVLLQGAVKERLLISFYNEKLQNETDEVKRKVLEGNIKVSENNIKKIKNISRAEVSKLYATYKQNEKIFDDALTFREMEIIRQNTITELVDKDFRDVYLENTSLAKTKHVSSDFELDNGKEKVSAEMLPINERGNEQNQSVFLKDANGKVYKITDTNNAVEVDPVSKKPIEILEDNKITKNNVSLKVTLPVRNKVNEIKKKILVDEYSTAIASLKAKSEKVKTENVDQELIDELENVINEIQRRIDEIKSLDPAAEDLNDIKALQISLRQSSKFKVFSLELHDLLNKANTQLLSVVEKYLASVENLQALYNDFDMSFVKTVDFEESLREARKYIEDYVDDTQAIPLLKELEELELKYLPEINGIKTKIFNSLNSIADTASSAFEDVFYSNKLGTSVEKYNELIEDLFDNDLVEDDTLSGLSIARIQRKNEEDSQSKRPEYIENVGNFLRPAIHDEVLEKEYNRLLLDIKDPTIMSTSQHTINLRNFERLKKIRLYQKALSSANESAYLETGLLVSMTALAENGPLEKAYPHLINELRNSIYFATIVGKNEDNSPIYEYLSYSELKENNRTSNVIHVVFLNKEKLLLRGGKNLTFNENDKNDTLLINVALYNRDRVFRKGFGENGGFSAKGEEFRFQSDHIEESEREEYENRLEKQGLEEYDKIVEAIQTIPVTLSFRGVTNGVFNKAAKMPLGQTQTIQEFTNNNNNLTEFTDENGKLKPLSELTVQNNFGFKGEFEHQNISSNVFDGLPALYINKRWMPAHMSNLNDEFVDKIMAILDAISEETNSDVIISAIKYIGAFTLLTSRSSTNNYTFNITKSNVPGKPTILHFFDKGSNTIATIPLTKSALSKEANRSALKEFLKSKRYNYVFKKRKVKGSVRTRILPLEISVVDNKIVLGEPISSDDYLNSFSDKIIIDLKHPNSVTLNGKETQVSNSNDTLINYVYNLNATFSIEYSIADEIDIVHKKNNQPGVRRRARAEARVKSENTVSLAKQVIENNKNVITNAIDTIFNKVIVNGEKESYSNLPLTVNGKVISFKAHLIRRIAKSIFINSYKNEELEKFTSDFLRLFESQLEAFLSKAEETNPSTEEVVSKQPPNVEIAEIEKERQEDLKNVLGQKVDKETKTLYFGLKKKVKSLILLFTE